MRATRVVARALFRAQRISLPVAIGVDKIRFISILRYKSSIQPEGNTVSLENMPNQQNVRALSQTDELNIRKVEKRPATRICRKGMYVLYVWY